MTLNYTITYPDPNQSYGNLVTDTIGPDSVIDGKTYFQLANRLLRYNEDSSRIYYRISEPDLRKEYPSPLYETIISKYSTDNEMLWCAYDAHESDTLYTVQLGDSPIPTRCVVDSVRTINNRRYIYFNYQIFSPFEERQDVDKDGFSSFFAGNDVWIEGIGSQLGIHVPNTFMVGGMDHRGSTLFCVSNNDELIYRTSNEVYLTAHKDFGIISPCHDKSATKEDALDNVIKQNITPNSICTVYSAGGTSILTNVTKVDASTTLNPGFYILRTATATEKIVIQ